MQAENETEKLKIIIRGMKDEFRRYKERVKENEKRYREKTKREFIKNLLETLDALARAVQDLREGETKEGCEFLKKITGGKDKNLEMIYAGLLESYNVIPIAPEYGESFDDIKHTALEVIRDADYPENTIVKTVRAGYLFEDEIIRPAEVVISKGGGCRGCNFKRRGYWRNDAYNLEKTKRKGKTKELLFRYFRFPGIPGV